MDLREAASLVLDQFLLDEGRKIPIRAFVGGRRDPRFGRKARRFGSKAPLIDKGGELSVVDRFAGEHDRRPNAQLHTGMPLANFGPPAKNPKHRARQEALAHLYYHVGTYGKYKGGEAWSIVNPGIPSPSERLRERGAERYAEHEEMIDHIHRLLKHEARSMRRAAKRVVRKSKGLPVDLSQQELKKDRRGNSPLWSKRAECEHRAEINAEARHHDVQDHILSGALPTDRGERLINMTYLERYPRPLTTFELDYLPKGQAHMDAMYKLAFERGVLHKMVHEHDPKKVLDMARAVRR